MPSSSTLLLAVRTRTIAPLCPLFFPAITRTLSPFFNFILDDFRRERADALITALYHFGGDGAEHAVRLGLLGLLAGTRDKHYRIFIEAHIRTIGAAERFA